MALFKILTEKQVQPDQLPSSEKELHTLQDVLLKAERTPVDIETIEDAIEHHPAACGLFIIVNYNTSVRKSDYTQRFISTYQSHILADQMRNKPMSSNPRVDMDDYRDALRDILKPRDLGKIIRIVDYIQKFRDNKINTEVDPAHIDNTEIYLHYEETLKDHILVHFTSLRNGREIIETGQFNKGVDNPLRLGLTTHYANDSRMKIRGGYNFAFDLNDLQDYSRGKTNPLWGDEIIMPKYGEAILFFRANAIKAHHTTDSEPQCIFWGKNARNIHAIFPNIYYDGQGIEVVDTKGNSIDYPANFEGEWDDEFMATVEEIINVIMDSGGITEQMKQEWKKVNPFDEEGEDE